MSIGHHSTRNAARGEISLAVANYLAAGGSVTHVPSHVHAGNPDPLAHIPTDARETLRRKSKCAKEAANELLAIILAEEKRFGRPLNRVEKAKTLNAAGKRNQNGTLFQSRDMNRVFKLADGYRG